MRGPVTLTPEPREQWAIDAREHPERHYVRPLDGQATCAERIDALAERVSTLEAALRCLADFQGDDWDSDAYVADAMRALARAALAGLGADPATSTPRRGS